MGQNSKKITKRDQGSVSKGVRHQKNELDNKENQRITGLSHSGVIYLILVCSLYANYQLFQSVENLDHKIDSVQAATEKSIQKQFAQRGEIPIKITLDHQLQDSEKSLPKKRSPASKTSSQSTASSSSPSKPQGAHVNHLDQIDQIDITEYSVTDMNSYPKFHYYLSEQSRLYREMSAKVRDIVSDYVDHHRITGADRPEYFELLNKRDLIMNKLKDLQKDANEKWKQTHRSYAQNSSSRP